MDRKATETLTFSGKPTGWVEDVSNDEKDMTPFEKYTSYTPEFTAETEKKLLRKIDARILPFLVVIYIFNYLDRNSITQARLYGLQEDTGVKGAVYQTAISIFSAGYIIMQLPSTLVMTKVRPSIFLPTCVILWAIVSGCTGAVHNPAGLLTVRFFLGIIEAPFFPGAIYFLSCWYTKKELGIRMALLIGGLLLSNSFAGLISAGILSGMNGIGHLASWRWLFILEGLATIGLGLLAMILLPDYPATTKWLTEEERVIAQVRLSRDAGSEDLPEEEKAPLSRGVVWALKDYRVWLFAGLQLATTATISYSHFFPTLIKELGFKDNTKVLLLTAPPYMFAFLCVIALCYHADRVQKRSPHAASAMCVAIASTIVLIATPQHVLWVRYAFIFPITAGTFGVYATTYTWLSSTISVPHEKRAAAIGIANSLANLASLCANYFWLDKYQPSFQISWIVVLVFQLMALTCILTLRFSLRRSNRQFEKLASEISSSDEIAIGRLEPDAQRAVRRGFRYTV